MTAPESRQTNGSLGTALRSVFAVVANDPGRVLAIGASYSLAIGIANAVARSATGVLDPTTVSPEEVAAAGVAAVVAIVILLLVNVVVLPVTIGALSLAGSAAVYGDAVEAGGIVRRAFSRSLEAIGVYVTIVLLLVAQMVAVGLLALIVAALVGPDTGFSVLNVASLLVLIPVVYVFVRYSLAIPVVMREGRKPIQAMRRSWALVAGAWWWTFGLLLAGMAAAAFNVIISFRLFIGPDLISDFLIGAVISAMAALISVVLYGIGVGVAYAYRAPEDVVPPEVVASEQRVADSDAAVAGLRTLERPAGEASSTSQ